MIIYDPDIQQDYPKKKEIRKNKKKNKKLMKYEPLRNLFQLINKLQPTGRSIIK